MPDKPGILDTVSFQKQSATLRSFNTQAAVSEYLSKLPDRERQILLARFGLNDGARLTLEQIGKKLELTRERVRQIETEAMRKLHKLVAPPPAFLQGADLLFQILEDYGSIVRETRIFEIVLLGDNKQIAKNAILFILNLAPSFSLFKETTVYHRSWYIAGFDQELFETVIKLAKAILEKAGKPLAQEELLEKIRAQAADPEIQSARSEALESYLGISKEINKNPFQEWGLAWWPEIRPKDMGDKAYLVLEHHGRPEHYVKITELINKQGFDQRIAHPETVHNELIKNDRFVLVGRGIYALREWGYKRGVVADIIQEILAKAQVPLSRNQIIEEVLKQRFVKKNTIIVGLSNRERFRKTTDNKYTNV